MRQQIDLALRIALSAVARGSVTSLRAWHQREDLTRGTKPDATVVTDLDIRLEGWLRNELNVPGLRTTFWGEESGRSDGDSPWRWVVDAIDGTSAFLAGRDCWQTLVALERSGSPVAAVAAVPAQERIWWAVRERGSWSASLADGEVGEPRQLRGGEPPTRAFGVVPETYDWVPAANLTLRDWSVHPALLVAEGHLDVAVQRAGHRWDLAALELIVTEAGGRATRPDGSPLDHQPGGALWCRPELFPELVLPRSGSDPR